MTPTIGSSPPLTGSSETPSYKSTGHRVQAKLCENNAPVEDGLVTFFYDTRVDIVCPFKSGDYVSPVDGFRTSAPRGLKH